MSIDPKMKSIRIGTRGSDLAMFQAKQIAWSLQRKNVDLSVEIKKISTSGDKIQDAPLARIGSTGLFVKEIENALISNEINLAVHSCKDLPTDLPGGLVATVFCEREDPRDAFIGKVGSIGELPDGAKIGTSSLRRRSQLLALRPDLNIVDIRGNVDTRIRKIEEQGLHGTILAAAGVKRLEREDEIAFYFSSDEMIPAVGQGVIAVEIQGDDHAVENLIKPLNHEESATAVRAERSLMKYLEGGCQVPIGAHADIENGRLRLRAFLGSLDGSKYIKDSIEGPPPRAEALGIELAERMLSAGGTEILIEARNSAASL